MPTGGGIGAVVLDLDDTLIIEEATASSSLRTAATQVGRLDGKRMAATVLAEARRRWRAGPHHPLCAELGFSSWEGLWSTFEGGHPRLDGLRRWAPEYREATWQAALEKLGVPDGRLAGELGERFVHLQRRGHPLVEGAAERTQALAERYRLALLTNGPPDIQRHKIASTGLADCFDAVVVSGEVGLGKPDPAVFRLVLDELGAAPGSAVMVGDSWERDVLGARGAGMSAVWVSAGRRAPADVPTGVTVVRSLADLRAVPDRVPDRTADGSPGPQPKVKS